MGSERSRSRIAREADDRVALVGADPGARPGTRERDVGLVAELVDLLAGAPVAVGPAAADAARRGARLREAARRGVARVHVQDAGRLVRGRSRVDRRVLRSDTHPIWHEARALTALRAAVGRVLVDAGDLGEGAVEDVSLEGHDRRPRGEIARAPARPPAGLAVDGARQPVHLRAAAAAG